MTADSRRPRLAAWFAVGVLCFSMVACTEDPEYVSEPEGRVPTADLTIQIVEFPETYPAPGSGEDFPLTVTVTNVGSQPFAWPDPCPVVRWDWNESATSFGAGFIRLDCGGQDLLDPNASAEFEMVARAADDDGALRFLVDLVDPEGCEGYMRVLDTEDRSSNDFGSTGSCRVPKN